ncbi:hypothetical protein BCR33DRAFT_356967 [Rhizoclosmatium globosum]|uniref:Uncharacterized protein n=1 Tax=Rhizoclosmatium globosum TaxID=329046 RepID=A0A1Y2C0Y8_9FUNG|nr:hypothetical protein BCR33DRAFT_356967 [Rhizoclosmatium globosum]|eukprot:ORY40702.1 hypothetical protein BCR33DRAFT_356967 [Rhizoclosmatium globosum]
MPMIEIANKILLCKTFLGQNVMYYEPTEICFQGNHIFASVIAILVLIILLGILPLVQGVILYNLYRRGELLYDHSQLLTLDQKMKHTLYEAFKEEYFYMEPLLILEKGLIVIIAFLSKRTSSKHSLLDQ